MNIEDFILDSAKILDDKIIILYHTTTDSAKRMYEKGQKQRPPHPAFKKALKEFTDEFDKTFGFDSDFVTEVKGATLNNKEQIQIMGMLLTVNDKLCSLNTPFISKDSDDPDFDGNEIDRKFENLRIESYDYIFKQKTSAPEMDFPEESHDSHQEETRESVPDKNPIPKKKKK